MYCVWKRNDGYIAATVYRPRDYKGADGSKVTFEHLGEYEKWSDAHGAIYDARLQTNPPSASGV